MTDEDLADLLPGLDRLLEQARRSGGAAGVLAGDAWLDRLGREGWLSVVRLNRACDELFARRALDAAAVRKIPALAILQDGAGAGPAGWPFATYCLGGAGGALHAVICTDPADPSPYVVAAALADSRGRACLIETPTACVFAWQAAAKAAGRRSVVFGAPTVPAEGRP